MNTLSLGFSGCPNDTFTFYGLVHGRVSCDGFQVVEHIHDVELLNTMALRGELDVTKVSAHALLHLLDNYALLRSGAALGRGVGPLIVARPGRKLEELTEATVGSPGRYTTAELLLQLHSGPKVNSRFLVFDQIMPAVQRGEVDFGLIIHEGRFTYQQYGLEAILDLGSWWEGETGLPLPLGGIVIRRSLGAGMAHAMEMAIAYSIRFARQNPEQVREYVRSHAQEMEESVVQQHIDLYVNDESLRLSKEGERAVHTLLDLATKIDALPANHKPVFLT